MRWLNPSAVLNFRKPSMDFEMSRPGMLRFMRYFSFFGKMSIAVRRVNQKPEPDGLWFSLSSGGWIRTNDLRVMREKPDFGNFDHITTQISQLYVLRFRRTKQAAVVNKYSYNMLFDGGIQVLLSSHRAFQRFHIWSRHDKPRSGLDELSVQASVIKA